HRAVARQLSAAGRGPHAPAQAGKGQPPRQARVRAALLERPAARPQDARPHPDVDGRQAPAEGVTTMPANTLNGRSFEVDTEGFLTRREQWDEELAADLARLI